MTEGYRFLLLLAIYVVWRMMDMSREFDKGFDDFWPSASLLVGLVLGFIMWGL